MAWIAVDKDGSEYINETKPVRLRSDYWGCGSMIQLPTGTIECLIGRKLTWDDEPVELKEQERSGE